MKKRLVLGRYAKLTVDWTFKRVFGQEGHEKLLLFLLNSYLKDVLEDPIVEVTLRPTLVPAENDTGRTVIFDVGCEDKANRRFVVEMQVDKQEHFMKRTLYYASRAISGLVQRGGSLNFDYPRLYVLSFVNFHLDFGEECKEVVQIVSMVNRKHPSVFYNNLLHMVFVRLTKFRKKFEKCNTDEDKMLFLLRHAHKIQDPPEALTKGIFGEVLELARISKFTQDELDQYEARMMTERDRVAALVSAEHRGERRGENRGAIRKAKEFARWMLAKGMKLVDIEEATHLSKHEILALQG
jgi:predicted transposase/invertase (TIGR01784 family)